MLNTKKPVQPIPTVLVVGHSQSGKTRLLEGWARDCPISERWTIIFNDANQALKTENLRIPVDRVHSLQLFGGCVCCVSKMVLETHLSRTLRIHVPDRLFIEIDSLAHINIVIKSLSAAKWQSWIKLESLVVVVTPRSLTLSPIKISTPLLKAIFINCIDEVSANQAEQALLRLASEHSQGIRRVVSPVVNDSSTLWAWHTAGTLIMSNDKLITT
jgi:G3E family GTPase